MKYDTIVVGAGSAGAILATRLSEDPERSVLLLEAGPDYPDFAQLPEAIKFGYGTDTGNWNPVHNWQYIARATDKIERMPVPRGKVTGGSSAINAQIFLRGEPDDYDSWASLGNDRWSFDQLLPYFRKLETDTDIHDDFHGTEGPILARRWPREGWQPVDEAFHQACRDAGFADSPDHNNPDATGVGPLPFNNPDRVRFSTAVGYLSQSRHRLNLTIRSSCTVHRIVFDGTRATGVLIESEGEMFTVEGGEIIVSAGAIASPQLLMLSGVGPRDQLDAFGIPVVKEAPGVGQNLRDHPIVGMGWRHKERMGYDPSVHGGGVALRYTASGSDLRNDMMVIVSPIAFEREDRWDFTIDRSRPIEARMTGILDLAVGSGELRLASTDPNVQPHLDYRYLDEEFDRRRLRDMVRLCVELSEHEALSKLLGERVFPTDADLESDDALDDWLRGEVSTGHHISCTCKMGPPSDPMAVVDQFGKVHGLKGLRVADASIMPDCIRANTNVTTMMIGERIADFVRQGE